MTSPIISFREPPPSLRGIAVARTGGGKTEWMFRRWLRDTPRLLVVDQTGEWRRLTPHAHFTDGLTQTIDALHRAVTFDRFIVVASLSNDELYELIDLLIPVGRLSSSPAAAVNGMVLYLDEVDLVIPTHAPGNVRSIHRRSRHAGLTVLSATQRISNVSKEITSMSDFIAILAIHEPACLDYLESMMGRENLARAMDWTRRPYHVAVWRPPIGELLLLPPAV